MYPRPVSPGYTWSERSRRRSSRSAHTSCSRTVTPEAREVRCDRLGEEAWSYTRHPIRNNHDNCECIGPDQVRLKSYQSAYAVIVAERCGNVGQRAFSRYKMEVAVPALYPGCWRAAPWRSVIICPLRLTWLRCVIH